jgi:hypothetical protein
MAETIDLRSKLTHSVGAAWRFGVNFSLDYYMNCYMARVALKPSSPLPPVRKTRAKSPQAVTQTILKTAGLLSMTVHQRPEDFDPQLAYSMITRRRPQISGILAVTCQPMT